MHLTLKQQATRPAGANFLQQQARFDAFVEEFNLEKASRSTRHEMPRRGLHPVAAVYIGIPEPDYPFHDWTLLVASCGRICLHRKKINLSKSLAVRL
jgi:putative transposase